MSKRVKITKREKREEYERRNSAIKIIIINKCFYFGNENKTEENRGRERKKSVFFSVQQYSKMKEKKNIKRIFCCCYFSL